jgi:hypothetical protein
MSLSRVPAKRAKNGPDVEQPAQFAFLDSPSGRMTKSFGLWDLTPWQVIYTSAELRQGNYLASVERTFEARGHTYRLTLNPARINRNGVKVEEYPGEREHLIELAIRKIAIQQRKLNLEVSDKDVVAINLQFYDLYKELQSTGHTFGYKEIEEALVILNTAKVTIQRTDYDGDGEPWDLMLGSAILPVMRLRKAGAANKEERSSVYIQVNPLLAEAIRNLDFHDLNYETLMSLKPVSRYIYKRLQHAFVFGENNGSPTLTLAASAVRDACGLNYSRSRKLFEVLATCFEDLKRMKLIESVTEEGVFQGEGKRRSKIDAMYCILPSADFAAQALQAQMNVVRNIEAFEVISGGKRPSQGWIQSADDPKQVRASLRTKRTNPAAQTSLPLLELVVADQPTT